MDAVPSVALDVRIDDDHHLPPLRRNVLLHRCGARERTVVPREVPLPVRVLDIQPDHVVAYARSKSLDKEEQKREGKGGREEGERWIRNVVSVEVLIDSVHVSLVPVVPPALVISNREHLWHCSCSCQRGIPILINLNLFS